ncbi:hypothetical protein [Geobacillus thermodenitrificans]|uniref:hypothetical protein n=1 Tax=Geobacillus thermodenitrificans TaxID=33940 RepID=UPI002E223DB9|nr:hypothetical protein [Geobacillus thermodenitrificans]
MGKWLVPIGLIVWYIIYRFLGHTPKYPISCEYSGAFDMCDYPEDYRINLFGWIWLFSPIWIPLFVWLFLIIKKKWKESKWKITVGFMLFVSGIVLYLTVWDSSPFSFTPEELREEITEHINDTYSDYLEGVELKGVHYEQVIVKFNKKYDRLKEQKQKSIYDDIAFGIIPDIWKKFSKQREYVDWKTKIKGEDVKIETPNYIYEQSVTVYMRTHKNNHNTEVVVEENVPEPIYVDEYCKNSSDYSECINQLFSEQCGQYLNRFFYPSGKKYVQCIKRLWKPEENR